MATPRPAEWRTLIQSEDRILRYGLDASPGYVRLQVIELVPEPALREVLFDHQEMLALLDRIEQARDELLDDRQALRKIILNHGREAALGD